MIGIREQEFITKIEEELHKEIKQKAALQGLSKEELLQRDSYLLGRLVEQNKILNGFATM